MPTKQHIVSLRWSVGGCRYDVRINDVPIFQDLERGYPTTANMSVNEFIVPDDNDLSIHLSPAPGEKELGAHSRAELTLMVRPHTARKGKDVVLTNLIVQGGAAGPEQATEDSLPPLGAGWGQVGPAGAVVMPPAGLLASRRVSFTLPAYAWRWLKSDVIAADATTRRDLEKIYTAIWTRLSQGQSDWVYQGMQERHAEMAQALFEPVRTLETENGLHEAVRDSSSTLFPLELPDAVMQVYGGGRLARLVRWDGRPLVVFVQKAGGTADYYPITLRRQGSAWIICR